MNTDVTTHFFCSCPKLNSNREYFWDTAIPQFDVKLESYLGDLSDEKLTAVILGADIDFFKDSSDIKKCSLLFHVSESHLLVFLFTLAFQLR